MQGKGRSARGAAFRSGKCSEARPRGDAGTRVTAAAEDGQMIKVLEEMINTKVPEGSAVLRWLGQMGLLVKMGNTLLCIDYFASDLPGRQVPPPIPAGEMTGIDFFLGTHNHIDHIDHPAWRIWAKACPGAKFVFPMLHQAEILADGIAADRCIGMSDGGCVRAGEITLHAVAASHEFLDPDPASGLYPCLQYVIEGNGVRLYHAGDTVRYEGLLPKLKELGPIDAALLPVNGRDAERYRRNCIGNMIFQEAADLAGELRPGLALPGHWDMFADNPGDPDAFVDYLTVKYRGGIKAVRPSLLEPVWIGRNR